MSVCTYLTDYGATVTIPGEAALHALRLTDLPGASGAVFSDDGRYRYLLWRRGPEHGLTGSGVVVFCMLNPSKAGAADPDATIRRCLGFARRWGFGCVVVVNLYAYVATYPGDMLALPPADRVGPENRAFVEAAICSGLAGRLVVCAWGANAEGADAEVAHVASAARDGLAELTCLGTTKGGYPRHPLRLAGATPLKPFSPSFQLDLDKLYPEV